MCPRHMRLHTSGTHIDCKMDLGRLFQNKHVKDSECLCKNKINNCVVFFKLDLNFVYINLWFLSNVLLILSF